MPDRYGFYRSYDERHTERVQGSSPRVRLESSPRSPRSRRDSHLARHPRRCRMQRIRSFRFGAFALVVLIASATLTACAGGGGQSDLMAIAQTRGMSAAMCSAAGVIGAVMLAPLAFSVSSANNPPQAPDTMSRCSLRVGVT